MLVQVTTPRPLFDHSKYPSYIHIHTLRKPGVSKGEVFFSATVDPEHGTRDSTALDPVNMYPIEGADGFEALEYIAPFWKIFKPTAAMSKAKYLGASAAEQGVRVGSVALARYFTNGFSFTAKSAFRADRKTYVEHTVSFTLMSPSTGGGILRLADCHFDIANPTFDPWAPNPNPHPRKNLELQDAFNRTHRLSTSAIDARRDARVREAEANMRANEAAERAEQRGLPGPSKALPPKR